MRRCECDVLEGGQRDSKLSRVMKREDRRECVKRNRVSARKREQRLGKFKKKIENK